MKCWTAQFKRQLENRTLVGEVLHDLCLRCLEHRVAAGVRICCGAIAYLRAMIEAQLDQFALRSSRQQRTYGAVKDRDRIVHKRQYSKITYEGLSDFDPQMPPANNTLPL